MLMYTYLLCALLLAVPTNLLDNERSSWNKLPDTKAESSKAALISLASHYRKINSNFINNGKFFLESRIDSETLNRKLKTSLSQAKARNTKLTRIINKVRGSNITNANFFVILKEIQGGSPLGSWREIIDDFICVWDPDCDIVPPTGPGGLPIPPINPGTTNLCNILETNAGTICSNLANAFEECGRGADPVAMSIVAQCEINAQMMVQQCEMATAQGQSYQAPVLDYSGIIEAVCVQFSPSQPQTESSEGNR